MRLLLLPAVLALLGTWAFVGRMAWVKDGEAIPHERLTGVRHKVGRVLRYVGWVLYFPVTLIGLGWRKWVRKGHGHDPTTAQHVRPLRRLAAAAAVAHRCIRASSSCSSSRSRCCRCGLGFSDDGGTPKGSPTRIAYDLTAEGFGPGVNGPFYIAVQLPKAG